MPFYGGNASENKTVTSGNSIFFSSCQILLPRFYADAFVVSDFFIKKIL